MADADARRRNHWVNQLARHAYEKPDAVYLRFQGTSTTWGQLETRVAGIAAAMRARGARAGQRVAIMMTNRPEFLETMFAAHALGAEVENALSAHPAVAELAVFGTPHERWGETPVAVAALRPGAVLTIDELREWGAERIARYKLPTILHVVAALPRNASGKVMKTALREQFR